MSKAGPDHRRDDKLARLLAAIPYAGFLGVRFDRAGDELTAVMPFRADLIGNPMLPALHGGATSGFLEVAALVELMWSVLWEEEGGAAPEAPLVLPKTIDFTIDYLRSGQPRDSFARARVARSGRRYANVHVEAWQERHGRPHAQARGHFLLPGRDD